MLKETVDHYLSVRRAAGFGLKSTEPYLKSFARFAADRGDTHVVAKTAIQWASESRSEAQRHTRLNMIIRFARFIQPEDARHEIPPGGVFCGHRTRPTPYIFSAEEICNMVTCAASLWSSSLLRPHTYSTLFGLLAVTGMRVSEALALRLNDVTADGLCIRESKFRKSRFLPLHGTAIEALQRYLKRRRKLAGHDDHIFVSSRRRQLSRTVVVDTFRRTLNLAGIPKVGLNCRPRLMDLRHTFAVRSLETCPDGRDNIRRHMLALTTYMGHARLQSTYWYLESTPQLMMDIARASEAFIYGESR